jgi:hypothetical protein
MPDPRPSTTVFFRHLPKTAGTSLLTTLANVYGEAHCHRFHDLDDGFHDELASIVTDRGETLSLLSGHISLVVLEEGSFGTEFTILRDPIARLLSLRRFFEGRPAAVRGRLGLGDRVTIAELLASRHPEVYGQVRNGMTRYFCGRSHFANPNAPEFWEPAPEASLIEWAETVLTRLAVGTVEEMPAALRRLGHVLRVPYDLEIPVENTTSERDDAVSLHDVLAIVEANAVDIAIYHRARKRFSAWSPPYGHRCGAGFDPRTVFDPQPGGEYEPHVIPGRQGFLACEVSPGPCWIGPSGRGRIHLAPSSRHLALSFMAYGVVPHYPMDDVVFTLDGRPWSHEHHRGDGHSGFFLAAIPPHANPIELAITQPCTVPVSIVEPRSRDHRSLGVAITKVLAAG